MEGDIDESVDQISDIFKGNVQWVIKRIENAEASR